MTTREYSLAFFNNSFDILLVDIWIDHFMWYILLNIKLDSNKIGNNYIVILSWIYPYQPTLPPPPPPPPNPTFFHCS